MDQDRARELFSDYLEGELSPEDRDAFEAHVAVDPRTRGELEAFRKTIRSLSGLKQLPPPNEFAKKVEHRIRRRSRGRFFAHQKLLWRLPFEWFSFVIIVLLLMMYLTMVLDKKQVQPDPERPAATGESPGSARQPQGPSRSAGRDNK